MNTLICMQSHIVSRLKNQIDEYLNAQDIPVSPEVRAQFLTDIMTVDFTTLNHVRNIDIIADNKELFRAYLDFSDEILKTWDEPKSIRAVEVLTVESHNVRILADVM